MQVPQDGNYTIAQPIQLISKTKKCEVYFAAAETNMALKFFICDNPSIRDLEKFKNEKEMSSTVSHPVFRSCFTKLNYCGKEALLLEWANGNTLDYFSDFKSFGLAEFLNIAREIVSGLVALHEKGRILLNLSCDHIIYDDDRKILKIISLGSSVNLFQQLGFSSLEHINEINFHCLSPERTGKTSYDVDYRSDLYSLGIILFRVLTGKYPFTSENLLDLVHLHITETAPKANRVNSDIPLVIADMIEILLRKDPSERYQSAIGVLHDIEMMINELDTEEGLASVTLRQRDMSSDLFISNKLYRHQNQFEKLVTVLRKLENSFHAVMLAGDTGVGKSKFVASLYKPILENGGIVMRGKFDESRNEPFSALIQALSNFTNDLLLTDSITRTNYKYNIREALGDDGSLLTNLSYNLQLVIGEQPTLALPFGMAKESKDRLNYVLIKFFKAITSISSVTLILEDLHFSDDESIVFLDHLMHNESIQNFLLVGTYKEADRKVCERFSHLMCSIKKTKTNLTFLRLDNFGHEEINSLVSDTLCLPQFETFTLSAFIYKTTHGNLFFVTRLLKSLFEQKKLYFCKVDFKWKWITDLYEEGEIAGDVKKLICDSILKYDKFAQQALKIASCLGSFFHLPSLMKIINHKKGIENVLKSGMIVQSNGNIYRFAHDLIYEAAFSLLPNDPREVFKYVGKKMWKTLEGEELDANLLVIVKLLNNATRDITDQLERSDVASLFLKAGKKALSSTAFQKASDILHWGLQLLDPDCWEKDYDYAMEYYHFAADAIYCAGNQMRMKSLISIAAKRVKSPKDLGFLKSFEIRLYNDKLMYKEALDSGIKLLKDLGENVDYSKCVSSASVEIERAKILAASKNDKDIANLQFMKDYDALFKFVVYRDMLAGAFFFNREIYALIAARMIILTFDYGFCKCTPLGFCALGSVLAYKRDKTGYHMGRLALNLLNIIESRDIEPYVNITFYCFINPFYSHIFQSLDNLLKAHVSSLEVGIVSGATISAEFYCHYSFLSGVNLRTLIDNIENLKGVKAISYQFVHEAVINLMNDEFDSSFLQEKNSKFSMTNIDSCRKDPSLVRVLVIRTFLSFLFYDFESAYLLLEALQPLSHFIFSTFHYPYSVFLEGLTTAALARKCSNNTSLINRLEYNLNVMKALAKSSPESYSNKLCLLEADLFSLKGNDIEALASYTKAISLAKNYGFKSEEAIANEITGIHYLQINLRVNACDFLQESFRCYGEWGSKSKMHHLKHIYPFAFKRKKASIFLNRVVDTSQSSGISYVSDISFETCSKKRVRFANI